jgi:RNA polymerase sigma-70 factor (ECF subfamily)
MMSAIAAELPTRDEIEEALAARARDGVPGAFSTLVGRYQHRIYRLALRLSGNESDAEEIAQEAFLRAHRAMRTFRGQARFGTWLYRITVNEALMRKRAASRRGAAALEELHSDSENPSLWFAVPDADELLNNKASAERVRDALDRLDDDHRSALVLRDLEELPAEVVAQILGISADAVRQRARRARLKMRELLVRRP